MPVPGECVWLGFREVLAVAALGLGLMGAIVRTRQKEPS